MRVFVTGATGFIGSRVVPELLAHGHTVLGLTRSEEGAARLKAQGAEPFHGNLNDVETLKAGAAQCDGVIHLAYDHDFSSAASFAANAEKDRAAITAMASVLGTEKPIVITSGVGLGTQGPGTLALETVYDEKHPNPRKASEEAGRAAMAKGANVIVVRLPQVHDTEKQGLIPYFTANSKAKGYGAYVGEGTNRFAAAHVNDVAQLYRLALEKNRRGAVYNAVAEEGVAMKSIVEATSKGLGIPARSIKIEEASEFFGWMAMFGNADLVASSAITRKELDWNPSGPDLITDLNNMDYSKS